MIDVHHSDARTPNEQLKEVPAEPGERNSRWLERVGARDGVVLIGGCTMSHFRVRVAQSHLREDLFPSLWSQTGILDGQGGIITVPLDSGDDASLIPCRNGIRHIGLEAFDDPARFPNIAVLRFADNYAPLCEDSLVGRLQRQRSIIDLPAHIIAWLCYVWAVGNAPNPLYESKGLPCAAFVEVIHSVVGIELTPGLSSSASCPEAIWQAARWWAPYYEKAAEVRRTECTDVVVPSGVYALRQKAAAVTFPPCEEE